MKNLSKVSKMSQAIDNGNRSTWLPLFYSFRTDSVYTVPGPDRFEVTCLIRANSSEDIKAAVDRWKMM
jgi:hypothetical protein